MKSENMLNFHGKICRVDGSTFRLIATRLGKKVLFGAECVCGPVYGKYVDLNGRTKMAQAILKICKLNLVS